MYTIRVSDGVDKVIAKWKKSKMHSMLSFQIMFFVVLQLLMVVINIAAK